MKDLLNSAEYSFMLGTNTVNGEVRSLFFADIYTDDEYLDAFGFILENIFKGIDNERILAEEVYNLVETEYNESGMGVILGNFSNFSSFIEKLIEVKIQKLPYLETIEDFKSLIDIADNLPEKIAISIYEAVLARLVYSYRTVDDIDFTQKVINYVRNSTINTADKKFYAIVSKVINHMH